jgi:ATP-dependent Clp protease adaptor protein ClpS
MSRLLGSSATKTKEKTEVDTRTSLARPWNVVVHDDPVTLMSYVTNAFMEVFGYSRTKAERLMLEVHKSGRSVVWTGGREPAEVYAQKLLGYHLLATLEQVDA